MYSDENKSSAVAAILNRFDYVLIDTCSLMDPACPIWMDALHNAKDYRKKKEPIIVPRRCYDELKKHARDRSVDSRRIAAKRGLKILRRAKWDHLLAVAKKDKNENFADNAIYVKVCADRLFSRILIITQDKSLASDLLALNKLRSQQGRPVEVYKLVNDGKMVPNLGESGEDRRENRVGGYPKQTPSQPTSNPQKPSSKGNAPTGVEAIVLADARLSAVLNNSNYPEEKKKADAAAQLKAINALPAKTRANLSLHVSVERLTSIAGVEAKPAPKAEPAKKAAPKPEPKKKEAPKPEPAPKKEALWYGAGKTVKEAFLDCAKHYGILFRAGSVKYFEGAHGPLDVTEKDLDLIAKTLEERLPKEEKPTLEFQGAAFIATKYGDGYHCYIDLGKEAKAGPKASKAAPKKAPAKPVEEKVAKAKKDEEKPAEEAKSAKPKAVKKEKAPETEKPAKAASSKAKPAKEEKPAEKPAKPKKKAESAPEKAAEEAVQQPKPKPVEKTPLEKAKVNDRALVCNLKNPNYADAKKEKAIKAQLQLFDSLSVGEIAELKYGREALEKALAELPKGE